MINAAILLILVSTVIPYQFAYMVACVVQLATCVRAQWHAKETVRSREVVNFANCSLADNIHIEIHYAFQLYQLRSFNPHPDALDSPDQRACSPGMGPQPFSPLVHAVFITP